MSDGPRGWTIVGRTLSGWSKYDALLAALPLPLAIGIIGGVTTSVPISVSTGLGGLLSMVILSYALFVAAPVS